MVVSCGAIRSTSGRRFFSNSSTRLCGVIDRVDDLFVEQPRIGGVQHRADARDGEEQLQVPMGVPGDRGDPVALAHAQRPERLGGLLGAPRQPGVVVADDRPLDLPRDDLPRAVRGWRRSAGSTTPAAALAASDQGSWAPPVSPRRPVSPTGRG